MDKKKENKGKRRHCLARIAWSEEKWQGFNMDDVVNAGEEIKKYGDIGYVTKYKFAHDWFTFYPDLHEIDDKFEKGYYYGYVQASGRGEDREHHPEEHGFINGCSLIFFLSTKENKRFIVGVYGKAEFLRNNRKSISMEKLKGFPFNETNVGKKGIKNVEFNIRGAKEYSVVFDKFIPVEEIEKSLNIKIDMRSAMTSYKFREVEFDDKIASKILCIAREKSEDEKVKETINKILNLIHGICLSAFLPQDYLKDLLVSVLAKPFVILAGITGTGKSLVAKEFAKAICAKHILIPVRPDWTDSSGLLGYKNVFTNQWVSTPFLEFILAADKDKDTPYVAILDEMNLARVEYYFSDFLSVLEDKERRTSGMNIEKLPMAVSYTEEKEEKEEEENKKGKKEDECKNDWKKKWLEELKQEGKLYKETDNGDLTNNFQENESLETSTYYINLEFPERLPSNLIVIGTVNMDETTYAFSPKVLDRANTIEFVSVDLEGFKNFDSSEKQNGKLKEEMKENFIKLEEKLKDIEGESLREKLWKKVKDKEKFIEEHSNEDKLLIAINKTLAKRNFHFGYRTYQEIWFYLYWWKQVFGDENLDTALDFQILQKILPKINGSSERIGNLLDELIAELLVNNASTLELILGGKNSGDIENIKDESKAIEAIKDKIGNMDDNDVKDRINKLCEEVKNIDFQGTKNQYKYLRSLYKLLRMKERLIKFDTTSFYEY